MNKIFSLALFIIISVSCTKVGSPDYEVRYISAMKNVMWKGELKAKVKLDTVLPQKGFYGLGPLEGLAGEITVIDGISYVSTIENNKIKVDINSEVGAPFFVYSISERFQIVTLPDSITTLAALNNFLTENHDSDNAYLFKFKGSFDNAKIHVQNLAPGIKVSSPQEAHLGQVDFELDSLNAEVIGFYSNSAHGIYTHHDSNIHTHLISDNKMFMGHCDELTFDPKQVKLYISKKH